MKKMTYDYIWEKIIYSEIKKLSNKYDLVGKKYSLDCRNIDKLKISIYYDYSRIKNILKKNYYNISNLKSENKPQNRIDSHKIAACLCYSIIQNKAFSFDIDPDIPNELFVINYTLAYTVSLSFIYSMLIAQYIKNNQIQFANALIAQKCLKVPLTTKNHDKYHTGRIYTLALNDIYGNTFDVLTYSDMMF